MGDTRTSYSFSDQGRSGSNCHTRLPSASRTLPAALPCPSIVFITAHDRYAINAFDIHAVDYLLKPVSHARLQDALERVRRDLEERPRAGFSLSS